MKDSPDQDWVAKLSASGGEQENSLAELREILSTRMQRAFRSNSKIDDAFVEDAVQDGLVTILNSLNDFKGRSQFTTWATTITIRIAITEMRRRRWKDVSLDELSERESPQSQPSGPNKTAEADMQRSQFIDAMHQVIREQLTEKQKSVLLAELQGMPQEEIGRRTGSNRNAIYKLMHDARKRLKKGLLEAGYSAEDLSYVQGAST